MAWSTPKTWTASEQVDASEMNTELRDNLNETAPGIASASGRMIVTDGANSIVERIPAGGTVATSETTASTTYANLATAGPGLNVTTGTEAIVIITATMRNDTAGGQCIMSFAISGATTLAASDANSLTFESGHPADQYGASRVVFMSGLTAGSNTFSVKYRVSSGTGTFVNRDIAVIPL